MTKNGWFFGLLEAEKSCKKQQKTSNSEKVRRCAQDFEKFEKFKKYQN
jgi:hypothetical protein